MRTRSIGLLVAVVAALALAVPATGAIAAPTDDVPVAQAGTIQAGDVPSTFTERTPPSSQMGSPDNGSNPVLGAALETRQCKAFVAVFGGSPEGVTASAQGAQLDNAGSLVASSVLVSATAAEAEQLYQHATDPTLAACLNRLFRTTVAQSHEALSGRGVKLVKLTTRTGPKTVPAAGDETTSFETKITMRIAPKGSEADTTARRATVRMYFDVQLVRVGRALAFYEFLGVDAPLTAVQEPAVAAAAARLAESQGS